VEKWVMEIFGVERDVIYQIAVANAAVTVFIRAN
jgi:hypothetical protein